MPTTGIEHTCWFQNLCSHMQTIQASASEFIDARLLKFVALATHCFNHNPAFSNEESSIFTPGGSPLSFNLTINTHVPSHAAVTSPCPQYTLIRDIVSVVDVWREYVVGLSGRSLCQELEALYGTSWRRRKVLYL